DVAALVDEFAGFRGSPKQNSQPALGFHARRDERDKPGIMKLAPVHESLQRHIRNKLFVPYIPDVLLRDRFRQFLAVYVPQNIAGVPDLLQLDVPMCAQQLFLLCTRLAVSRRLQVFAGVFQDESQKPIPPRPRSGVVTKPAVCRRAWAVGIPSSPVPLPAA